MEKSNCINTKMEFTFSPLLKYGVSPGSGDYLKKFPKCIMQIRTKVCILVNSGSKGWQLGIALPKYKALDFERSESNYKHLNYTQVIFHPRQETIIIQTCYIHHIHLCF
jgi:hypothetical protein